MSAQKYAGFWENSILEWYMRRDEAWNVRNNSAGRQTAK